MSAELLTQAELAQQLGKSEAWLERGRWAGTGPAYVKVGRSVRYRPADVQAWLDKQLRVWTRQVDRVAA